MMNKRRTSEIGKAKYLLFAPLAGVLLMVSNIESVAREIGEQIPEVAEVQQKAEQALNADVVVANPTAEEAKAAAEAKRQKKLRLLNWQSRKLNRRRNQRLLMRQPQPIQPRMWFMT